MEIDKNTSYLIGLFQTDGNIYETTRNRGKASIELSSIDEDIIEKIKEFIPYNYTIKKRKRKISIENKTGKIFNYDNEFISIKICDMEFREFLKNCGVPSGRKSNTIKPPLFLKNLSIPDYIRGLYDGDGSLGITGKEIPFVSFITASSEISDFISNYIMKITGKPKKITNPNKRDNIYNIVITKEDAMKFCDEVYYEDCLSMKRKYEKSKIIKNWIRPKKMKNIIKNKFWNEERDSFIVCHTIEESMKFLNKSKKSINTRLYRLKNNFSY